MKGIDNGGFQCYDGFRYASFSKSRLVNSELTYHLRREADERLVRGLVLLCAVVVFRAMMLELCLVFIAPPRIGFLIRTAHCRRRRLSRSIGVKFS